MQVVRAMRHPDDEPGENLDPQQRRRRQQQREGKEVVGKEEAAVALEDGEQADGNTLYSRAGFVTKEVIRIPAQKTLGKQLDGELLRYLNLSLSLSSRNVPLQPDQQQQQQQRMQAGEKREHEQAGTELTSDLKLDAMTKKMVESAIKSSMTQRIDAWAASFQELQVCERGRESVRVRECERAA